MTKKIPRERTLYLTVKLFNEWREDPTALDVALVSREEGIIRNLSTIRRMVRRGQLVRVPKGRFKKGLRVKEDME